MVPVEPLTARMGAVGAGMLSTHVCACERRHQRVVASYEEMGDKLIGICGQVDSSDYSGYGSTMVGLESWSIGLQNIYMVFKNGKDSS
ncbi:MAG: hypothetical protein R2738_04365 [Bacteroides graminisolvens]